MDGKVLVVFSFLWALFTVISAQRDDSLPPLFNPGPATNETCDPKFAIHYKEMHQLHLNKHMIVEGTRHLPQLICADGTAKGKYELEKAHCVNLNHKHSDTPKWLCSPIEMTPGYRFSQVGELPLNYSMQDMDRALVDGVGVRALRP